MPATCVTSIAKGWHFTVRISRETIKTAAPFLTPLVRAWHRCLTSWRSRESNVTSHAAFLKPDVFDRVYFDGRGNHPTQHIRTTRRFVAIVNANVLALGCREGQEVFLWLRHGARSVTALDYNPRTAAWQRLRGRGLPMRFLAGDARQLPFNDRTFDIVSSEALLEHVQHPDRAIAEMHRVVKTGGLVYSIFGPLYFTAGGAHYEGLYEHLLQKPEDFVAWLRQRNRPSEEEGLAYLNAGMFSHWTSGQYLREFRKHDIVHSAVFLSPDARRFRRQHPVEWAHLMATCPERDLMISGLAFWSRKYAGARP